MLWGGGEGGAGLAIGLLSLQSSVAVLCLQLARLGFCKRRARHQNGGGARVACAARAGRTDARAAGRVGSMSSPR